MKNKKCAVISGGEYSPLYGIENADFIIACDKGCEYALKNGIVPDLFVGDGDSFSGEVPEATKKLSLPRKKDDTDTHAAIKHATELGYGEILLYCATGGRLDHFVANLQSAAFAAEKGAYVTLFEEKNTAYIFKSGSIMLKKRKNCSLSVFSLSEKCTGVNIVGAEYPLTDAVLTSTFPIGVSNEWHGDVEVSCENGIIMIALSQL